MVRHDEIGDYQVEFCKEATQGVTAESPVIGGSVKAGDHTVLLLAASFVAQASEAQPNKDITVTIQDSDDNSTWAAVAGSAVTHSVSGDGNKDFGQDLWAIDRNNVRRWVRAYFTTTVKPYSITASWIKAGNKVNSLSTQTNIIKL
tara:strand:+ start:1301 stop:1738 length:438 start_codon:yes stop_codon:yes gene_type:complete